MLHDIAVTQHALTRRLARLPAHSVPWRMAFYAQATLAVALRKRARKAGHRLTPDSAHWRMLTTDDMQPTTDN